MERYFLKVPDIQIAGDYFPQIAARLREYGRVNSPEITNEDPREPFIQAERAFALAAHYGAVTLDMVANSLFLKTATLPESVQLLLELIDYRLLPAGPARVEMLGKLSARYSTSIRLLEPYRKFATKRTADVPELVYENPLAVELTERNDSQGNIYGYGVQYDRESATGELESVYPDIVYDATGPFFDTDLNQYMSIEGSTLGNDIEDKRIVELLEPVPATSPTQYYKARLSGASFLSESPVTWIIRTITTNAAPNWNLGVGVDPLPGGLTNNDKIYFGHPDVMWDRVDVALAAPVAAGYVARLEFYDPTESAIAPDLVSYGSGQMTFTLTSLLGSVNCAGTSVEVTHISSGSKYRTKSTWAGGLNVLVITGYLGQTSSPSTVVGDYVVKAEWKALSPTTDTTIVAGSSLWSQSGRESYSIPQTQSYSWTKYYLYDLTDGELKYAYYLRLRIVDAAGGSCPTITNIRIDQGDEYALVYLVQGQTVEDSPLASSSGKADQEYSLTKKPYVISSARVFVDEGGGEYEWTVLTTLLRSKSSDKHCVIYPQTDGSAVIKFGDGVNGKIPAIGSNNIRAMYRIGADRNGNIGSGTLTVNRDGAGVFKTITNPRNGKYWIAADWASPSALEQAKERGPANLRTMHRAVNPIDMETLAKAFVNRQGIRPVARVKSYEEAFGPKTVELVVCGGGGAALTEDERLELEEYFNGGTTWGYNGVRIANSEVVVSNYSPRVLAYNIRVEAYEFITEELVKQLLSYIVNPTAIDSSNGRTYIWRFGQIVPNSRIQSEIFYLSPGNIFDVDVTSPTEDVVLTYRELPMFDYANSNITIIPPKFLI